MCGGGGGGESLQYTHACKYVQSTVPINMMSNRFKFDIIIMLLETSEYEDS